MGRKWRLIGKRLGDRDGATLVFVAIILGVLVSLTALAVDVGHLYIVRNELQNAADAGALAGAARLYNSAGTSIDTAANSVAYATARLNNSGPNAVEVNWTEGSNGPDVQRGHYSFVNHQFTANDSIQTVDLWNVSASTLDGNTAFINAVQVTTHRSDTPSFFARIFGLNDFFLTTKAVAYIGFAGTLQPEAVDEPFAICKQSILDSSGNYTCNVGRMINDGNNSGHETGAWTDFVQPCAGAASTNDVRPLVCSSGNPSPIQFGGYMSATNGMVTPAFKDVIACWIAVHPVPTDKINGNMPDQPWSIKLPVIDCPGNDAGNCTKAVGAVEITIVWITEEDPQSAENLYKSAPRRMGSWTCTTPTDGQACWNSFVEFYKLSDVADINTPATYQDKTMYFIPSCTYHEPTGTTGGENFGILAKYPVLVQ